MNAVMRLVRRRAWMSAIGPKQTMPKNAIDVAIGGKADMRVP